MNIQDVEATRQLLLYQRLISHCGKRLTADLIDQIVSELMAEMKTGPTSWSFKFQEETPA